MIAELDRAQETNRALPSIFANLIRDRHGKIKRGWEYRGNLRTTVGIDWQALVMGKGVTVTRNAAATASSSTTLTDSGAAFAGSNGLAGSLVIAAVSATAVTAGIITSNTGTVLTVASWSNGTPSATGGYVVLSQPVGQAYLALTTDAGAPAVGDTTLASELAAGGMSRIAGTYAHTLGTANYTLSNTFTATATNTINKEATFNAPSAGTMGFESAEPSPPTLVSGDTLAQTVTTSY